MPTKRSEFLGVGFDLLSDDQVLTQLARTDGRSPYAYVVTPNVDHVVRLHEKRQTNPYLKQLYDGADLCLCDSKILYLLARLRGVRLPVVPGSELTRLMFETIIQPGDKVGILGGDAELLKELQDQFDEIEFVQYCPPMGLRHDPAARSAAAQFVARCGARFTFVAVGSPQQEMIAAEAKAIPGAAGTALCVGASLEFLTGREKRAPRLAQRLGLEWAHRLASNPRRLWRRYLVEGPRVFMLAYRWAGPAQPRALSK